MKNLSRWALWSAALLALSACGNKGPLVLPERPAPVTTPAPADEPAADSAQPAAAGAPGATPPVQIKPPDGTTAPSPADDAADQALDRGGADGDG